MGVRPLSLIVMAASALTLSACAATTEPASNVSSTSATLNAKGRSDATPAHYEFQYAAAPQALGTGFGQQTPARGPVPAHTPGGGSLAPFSEAVRGLSPAKTYFDRVCGGDGGTPHDVCAQIRSFTTTQPGATVAFAASVSYAVHSKPAAVAGAHLQSGGSTDLVTANPSTNDLSVLLNTGYGTFAPAMNYAVSGSPVALAAGDLTGQGDKDVVAATGNGVSVLLGRGDGTLKPAVFYGLPAAAQSVVIGDFTGDGKADIAALEFSSTVINGFSYGVAQVSVLPGAGDGTFGAAVTTTVLTATGGAAANTSFQNGTLVSGRFDSSGKLDLAVVGSYLYSHESIQNIAEPFSAVLLNGGGGTFTVHPLTLGKQPASVAAPQQPSGLVSGPVSDAASATDLFYVNNEASVSGSVPTGAAYAYRQPGNGDGSFGTAQTIGTLAGGRSAFPVLTPALALAHLSSKVANDLVVSSPQQGLQVLPGNGDGTFKAPTPAGAITSSQGIAAADLNGDAKTDVAVGAPGGAASVAVLMNASPGG